MTARATLYSNMFSTGGSVDIEDDDMGRCTIVQSKNASPQELRRRAANKLRRMADQLERKAKRKAPPDGSMVEGHQFSRTTVVPKDISNVSR